MFPQNDPRQMGRYRRGQLSQPVQPMNPDMNTPNQPQMGTGQPNATQLSSVRMNPPNAFSYGGTPGQPGTGRDQTMQGIPPSGGMSNAMQAASTPPPMTPAQQINGQRPISGGIAPTANGMPNASQASTTPPLMTPQEQMTNRMGRMGGYQSPMNSSAWGSDSLSSSGGTGDAWGTPGSPNSGGTLPPAARAQTSRMQPPGMAQSQTRLAAQQMQNQKKPRF